MRIPTELLRAIILKAVPGPAHHGLIVRLCRVSKLWQSVVHDIPALFIRANWGRWPGWLLELWCFRARSQPLIVHLNADAMDRFANHADPFAQWVLESTCTMWGHLVIADHVGDFEDVGFLLGFVREVFEFPLTHLLSIEIEIFGSDEIDNVIELRASSMPALKKVNTEGVLLRASGTFAGMLDVECTLKDWSDWLQWAEFLSSCPHIQGMSVYQSRFMRETRNPPFPSSSLPSLRNLYIPPSCIDFSAPDNLLQSLSVPNLTSITLEACWSNDCAALCEILVSML
jgi:hypothetical protein